MPKESQFIKGSDALTATKVCFLYWNQKKPTLKKQDRNKSKWKNKSIIDVQNGTK